MRSPRSDWLPPLVIFVALATLAWAGWWRDVREAREQAVEISEILAASAAHRFTQAIDQHIVTLEPLRAEVEQDILIKGVDLPKRAVSLRASNPEFTAFAVVDPSGKITDSDSGSFPSTFARGVNINSVAGHEDLISNLNGLTPAISTVFQIENGRPGVGLALPIYDGKAKKLTRFLYVALDGDVLTRNLVDEHYQLSHLVSVQIDREKFLVGRTIKDDGLDTVVRDVLNRKVEVYVKPRRGLGSTGDPQSDLSRLLIYLFTALIIAATVWVALYERRLAVTESDERKAIADSLRISEARLSEIIARSPWPILENSRDGAVETANKASEELLGIPREQIRGHSILEWIHPEDRDGTRPLITDSSAAEGKTYDGRIIKADHSVRFLRWSRANRYNESGNITGGILFGQDVTASVEASRAQEKLIAEEERLIERLWVLNDFARSLRTSLDAQSLYQISITAASNVLANRACAILTYDPVSETFEVRAARAATGAAPPLPQGTRFPASSTQLKDALSESRQHTTLDLAAAATEHEKTLAAHGFSSQAAVPILVDNVCVGLLAAYATEKDGISRDGIEFLQGIAEHLALALTSSRLFSQLTEAYNATRTAQARIVEMEKLRAVGEMTSGIAHDFNNMLMSILGYAEMLDEPNLNEEQRDYVDKILTAASDAAATVKRLQEYSKNLPESDSFETLNLNLIAADAIDLTKHKWKNQAQSRGIVIQMNREMDPMAPTIRGSASDIREVLTNLIFNAVDAMPEGGAITVGTGRRGSRSLIHITDTGGGMTDEVRSKLFTPFFTTKGRQGNGLGLAMSYGIIQKHGGDVEVESAPGRGTTFSLLFPASTVERQEERKPIDREPMPSINVLVVDDDPDVAGAVAALIRKLEHTVTIAESGYEAVKRLKAGRFDAILTDLGMPGMSGKDLGLAAKDIAPNTPVILLTGWGDQVRAEGEIPPGVDLVLSKPIRLEQLENALWKIMQRRREKTPA